ncbi:MAG TPA: TonB family protein [Terriglobia bacterium]|nr:TonB family protein [Terriglobia bacterium]
MTGPLWFSNLLAWWAQAALLAAAGGLLPRAFGLRQPRVLLGTWRALLAACLALPLVEPWRRVPAAAAGEVTVRLGPATALGAAPWRLTAYEFIAAALLAGVLLRLAQVAFGLVRLRAWRRAADPLGAPFGAVEAMQAQVGSRAEFRLSSSVRSPVTFGWFRSVILLPQRYLAMPPRLQSAIACHELLHVRRRDWPHHVVEEFLRALLWFHPAVLWLIARLRLAREQVVDLEVLELLGARKPYLEALFEIAAGRALAGAVPAPPLLAERQLAERVALMLKEVSMSKSRLIASLTAILGAFVLAATLAVWAFPLKAAPQESPSGGAGQIVQPCPASEAGCPKTGVVAGVVGGVSGGVIAGVPGNGSAGIGGSASGGSSGSGVAGGTIGGVPSGVVAGVPGGVGGGVIGGIPGAFRAQAGSGGSSWQPEPVHKVQPTYPPEAKAAKIEGDVVLGVEIDGDGKVTNVEVKSGPEMLAKAAMDAVRQWEYAKPATAPMHFDVTVSFTLAKDAPDTSDAKQALDARQAAEAKQMYAAKVALDAKLAAEAKQTYEAKEALDSKHATEAKQAYAAKEALDAKQAAEAKQAYEEKEALDAKQAAEAKQAYAAKVALDAKEAAEVTVPASSLTPVKKVQPIYPPEAKNKHIQGEVVLRITVEKDGRVSNVEFVSGPAELVESALDAVRHWQYEPPAQAPVVTTVTVNYTLAP